jgi:predicted TIM-barrel fold metal-dependent hydrolase
MNTAGPRDMKDDTNSTSKPMEMPGIIDTDVHHALRNKEELLEFLPKVWHEQYMRNGTGMPNLFPTPIGVSRRDAAPENGGPPGSDPQFLLKHHIEAYNIDYAILGGLGTVLSLHPDLDYSNALFRAHNDYQIEKWLHVDPRLKGSLIVNIADPVEAVKEIERLGAHPDIVQIIVCSGTRVPFGQRIYHPIYEAAERYGLPVAIHPGSEGKAYPPTPVGYPTRYMEWHNIIPLTAMAQVNSLVCEGVFEKFPGLKFVVIEMGIAWLPHLMWRMDKNYKALRSSTPWLRRLPSEYIKEHIRLTTQPIEEPERQGELLQILHMIDAEKTVMFSSDYPHWDFDNPKNVLPPMPRDMKARILSGTASELYGLTLKSGKTEVKG